MEYLNKYILILFKDVKKKIGINFFTKRINLSPKRSASSLITPKSKKKMISLKKTKTKEISIIGKRTKQNYLITIFYIKKFIENLKTLVNVKKLMKLRNYHFEIINDKSSTYAKANEIEENMKNLSFKSLKV